MSGSRLVFLQDGVFDAALVSAVGPRTAGGTWIKLSCGTVLYTAHTVVEVSSAIADELGIDWMSVAVAREVAS